MALARPLLLPRGMRVLVLLLPCFLLPFSAAAGDFGRTVPVSEDGRLRIDLERGDVLITRHAAPLVRVVASARGTGADGVRFRLHESDSGLIFQGRAAPWLVWLTTDPRVEVRAWVPHGFVVDVETKGRVQRLDPGVQVSYPASQAP